LETSWLVTVCLRKRTQRRSSAPRSCPVGTDSILSRWPYPSLTIKMACIDAKIEQGGRLRRLLSKLPSRDQIVEDATDGRPFSSDVALCAIVLDQFRGAHLLSNDLRVVACGLTDNGRQ
jgi:hypothetical protein